MGSVDKAGTFKLEYLKRKQIKLEHSKGRMIPTGVILKREEAGGGEGKEKQKKEWVLGALAWLDPAPLLPELHCYYYHLFKCYQC